MNATDTIAVGDALPLIAAASPAGIYSVTIEWASGSRRGKVETIDLAPDILSFKFYRPLRDDIRLFDTVHVTADGAALAWGGKDEVDMAATSVERLAEETMTNADFAAFLKRSGLSLDAAAAQLGISRRLVAYYAKNRLVPRHIALACRFLELRRKKVAEPG